MTTIESPIYNMTDAWNNVGIVFDAMKMNVADTGHAVGSLLFNLQVDSSTKFSVDRNGAIFGLNFSSTAQGLVPASGGGTTTFLRADGTWASPAGSGAGLAVGTSTITGGTSGNFLYNNAGVLGERTPAQATAALNQFSGTLKGLVPASGGGFTSFLRADGTWVTPPAGGGLTDGDKGDITVSGSGTTLTIDNAAVTYAKMQNVSATSRLLGRITAGAGSPEELTGTQATTLLNLFTSSLKGLTPSSGGGTTNFLRADGTWATPAGGGGALTIISDTPPPSPTNGELWWESDTGILWIWYVDPDSSQWVETTTIADNSVTYAKMQDVSATSRLLGRITAGAGNPEELTGTQATTLLNLFTSSLKGLTPSSGGGTTNFLRADGTWATPAGGGGLTINASTITGGTSGNFLYNNAGTVGEQTPTQATALLNIFTSTLKGLVPLSGGGTTNFLRADGTWAVPAGGGGSGSPGGSTGQLQYNNASAFGGMSGTSWDDTNRSLTITGATVTTSKPVLDMTQTWNAAVAFTGLKLNITATSAAGGSKLLDLQLGGTSLFNVQPSLAGTVDVQVFLGGQTAAPAPSFVTDSNAINLTVAPPHTNGTLLLRGGSVPFAALQPTNGFVVHPNTGIGFALGGVTSAPNSTITCVSGVAKVLQFGDGGQNANGWMQWGGEVTATADLSKTSDTTLANITGMSVNVQAGRKYRFEVHLPCTCGATAGGVKTALAGTATWTSIIYDGYTHDGQTIVGNTRATAIATAVGGATTTSTTPTVVIKGWGTVNAAGTLTTQFAQNASSSTASVAKTGGTMFVFDMP